MTVEIAILFIIIGLATLSFILELFTVDKVALLVMVSLIVFGLVSPEEGISGFSNPAVITIMALMIISAALEYNGSIKLLSKSLIPIIKWPLFIALPVIMLLVGTISAFVSTTAVVVIFVKIMPRLEKKYGIRISKFMMPISFAGILGGSCTLMGTSTNLLVNQIAIKKGYEGFGFFDSTLIGIVFLIVGIVIVTSLSITYLKDRKQGQLQANYNLDEYVTRIKLLPESKLIGKSYMDTFLYNNDDVKLLRIVRQNYDIRYPSYFHTFKKDDILIVRAGLSNLLKMKDSIGVNVLNQETEQNEVPEGDMDFLEVLILPGSKLIGKSLKDLYSYDLNGAFPLAIKKHKNILNQAERFIQSKLSRVRLDIGDRLLVELPIDRIESWELDPELQVVNQMGKNKVKNHKKYLCLFILSLVIGLAATNLTTILTATLVGTALLILTRCLNLEKAYTSVNWQVIFLLAGLLPIGVAMSNTGADDYLGSVLINLLDGLSGALILSILFLITLLISSVISNNATAIIITPIAMILATTLNLDPKPFLMAVLFAANFSFFTPIGYQTNTIVYGMGLYKFRDFAIVGGIVTIVIWAIASFALPMYGLT